MTFACRGFIVGCHEMAQAGTAIAVRYPEPEIPSVALHEHALMSKPSPQELAVMREVYTAIVEAPWFNRNAVTERELLKLIFNAHSDGIGDHEAFGKLCRDEAQRRFSRTS